MNYRTFAACAVVVAFPLMLTLNASAVAGDYSKFSHSTHTVKEKLACDSCHKFPTANWNKVREGDAAFPDITEFPEHGTCLNCHRKQFFARQRPAPAICSNCHVNATPRNTARFVFPSLGEAFLATVKARDFVSDFRVQFPHEKHADTECADCHKPQPLMHAACFTCHNQESEVAPLPPNCDSCHKQPAANKRTADTDAKQTNTTQDWWTQTASRERISAGAFRHEPHADLKCAQCHEAPAMRAVTLKSCGGAEGCHVTATSDDGGILNYEIDQRKESASFACTKCHLDLGKKAIPASHLKAIEALKKSSAAASGRQGSTIRSSVLICECSFLGPQASRLPRSFFALRAQCRRDACGPRKERVHNLGHQPNLKAASSRQGRAALRVSYAHAGSSRPRYAMVQGQMKVPDNADYSKFQHASSYHARLPCALCHRRESNSSTPAMPGGKDHLPCAGCHVKQFADSSSAICTNCHDKPPAATLKSFPKLASFNVRFDHARHTGTTCASCHRPARGGVALTIPMGSNAHVTCFQCHGPNTKSGERDISACGVCHERGSHTRASQNARAFKVGFSHEEHNRNEGLSCNNCHRVRAGAQAKDVTAPQPLNHHATGRSFSCLSCHNGKRAFGGDDFSACKRCHTGPAWRF